MTHASGMPPTAPPAPSDARSRRRKSPMKVVLSVVLWLLQVGLAVQFVLLGAIPALTADPGAVSTFEDIGFGTWFMYLTGALELLGAIGLVTPWFSGLAAIGLVGVMSGAILTHVLLMDGKGAEAPLMLLVLSLVVAVGRWGTVRDLLDRVRGGGGRARARR